jgi:hypothetical protein
VKILTTVIVNLILAILAIFVLMALMALTTTAAEAAPIQCKKSPGSDGYYAWRLIDGKKCWYRGARGLAKSKLTWSKPADSPTVRKAAPRKVESVVVAPRSTESIAPRVVRTVPVALTPIEVIRLRWIY